MDLSSKVFGWFLLIVGLLIIGWTLLSAYSIFSGKTAVPAFFDNQEVINQEELADNSSQLESMITEKLQSFIPAESIIDLLNLMVWSMLAFILMFGGSQIAGLGIKLISKQ